MSQDRTSVQATINDVRALPQHGTERLCLYEPQMNFFSTLANKFAPFAFYPE